MNLTYEQVWATADELEAKGIKPTMKSVREALGKGSYTTVCKAMAERPERQFTTGADVKESLPPALTQHIERLGQQVWAAATAFANPTLSRFRPLLALAPCNPLPALGFVTTVKCSAIIFSVD